MPDINTKPITRTVWFTDQRSTHSWDVMKVEKKIYVEECVGRIVYFPGSGYYAESEDGIHRDTFATLGEAIAFLKGD